MVKKIRWSPKAADNFEGICAFIGKNSKFHASMFAKKINSIVTNIPLFPDSGRIVYRKKGQFIEIVTISHTAKQLNIEHT